jgi:hypothetical protein
MSQRRAAYISEIVRIRCTAPDLAFTNYDRPYCSTTAIPALVTITEITDVGLRRYPPKSTRPSGLPMPDDRGHPRAMGTKSREVIYGSAIRYSAECAKEARKVADRLAVKAWNDRMLGYQGPAQPSPTIGDALNAGYGYLEVRCLGCDCASRELAKTAVPPTVEARWVEVARY